MTVPRHPAKFTPVILERVQQLLDADPYLRPLALPRVLDPFAGVGGVHELKGYDTIGVELEPEWAAAHKRTHVGDATELPTAWFNWFDAIVTSPCYGNRMADHHDARDASRRNTYKHALGRDLSPNSAGAMQWGPAYWELHIHAWREAWRVLRPGGLAIINVGNHIREGREILAAEWHLTKWLRMGARLEHVERIATPRLRVGANHQARVEGEMLLVLRKP